MPEEEFTVALSSGTHLISPDSIIALLTGGLGRAQAEVPRGPREEAELVFSGGAIIRIRLHKGADPAPVEVKSPGRRRGSFGSRSGSASHVHGTSYKRMEEKICTAEEKEAAVDDIAQKARIKELKHENEALKRRLADLENNLKSSMQAAKNYHQSQQQLFNDFVLLRDKYDEAKAHLVEVLWGYLPQHTRYCPSIPSVQKSLVESDKRVGEYEVGSHLGEGQFAKVHSCWKRPDDDDGKDSDDERPEIFALKIVAKDKISSLAALKRIDSEIRVQRTLRHRGILRIVDVFNGKNNLYIVLEKGGVDLFDLFDQRPERLSEADCKRVTRAIVDAIHYCHSEGVCHRDLKPENILLNDQDRGVCSPKASWTKFDVKLCDFGLCSSFQPGKKLTDFCGSPGFFAPEMVAPDGYEGSAVDVWSIGCILLELTVGHELFCDRWMVAYDYDLLQDAKAFEAKLQLCVEDLRQLMTAGTLELNEALVDLILGMLTVDPTERLTIEEVAEHPWLALADGKSFLTTGEIDTSAMPGKGLNSPVLSPPTTPSQRHGGGDKKRGRPAPLQVKAEARESDSASATVQERHRSVAFSPSALAAIESGGGAAARGSAEGHGGGGMRMSHKARTKLEKQAKQENGSQRQLHLPPLEPMTPAVGAAKRLLWSNEDWSGGAKHEEDSLDAARHEGMLMAGSQGGSATSGTSSVSASKVPSAW